MVPWSSSRATRRARLRYLLALLNDRVIFIVGPITEKTANLVVAQMLFSIKPTRTSISIIHARRIGQHGMAIFDTMSSSPRRLDLHRNGRRWEPSCSQPAPRASATRCRTHAAIHQPWAVSSQAADTERQGNPDRPERLNKIHGTHAQQVEREHDRDNFITADQAKVRPIDKSGAEARSWRYTPQTIE